MLESLDCALALGGPERWMLLAKPLSLWLSTGRGDSPDSVLRVERTRYARLVPLSVLSSTYIPPFSQPLAQDICEQIPLLPASQPPSFPSLLLLLSSFVCQAMSGAALTCVPTPF
jgi:hypothetical protein